MKATKKGTDKNWRLRKREKVILYNDVTSHNDFVHATLDGSHIIPSSEIDYLLFIISATTAFQASARLVLL
jgi:selenocysteine-specific translation elongation factor